MSLTLLATLLLAHGDLHDQIQAVSAEIEKNPGSGPLYLKRGELRRFHEELQAARADLDQALKLDPKLAPAVDLARGRLEQQLGDPKAAVEALDRFLAREPKHGEARVARARALARTGDHRASAQEYTRAIGQLAEPRPEHYLERAQESAAADRVAEAIQGLDEGIQKLGPLVTLETTAIDLDLQLKRTDSALERLDVLRASSPRKDPWLVRRGDILRQAGRPKEARDAYAAALAAMETLVPRQRAMKYTRDLEARAQAALKELAE